MPYRVNPRRVDDNQAALIAAARGVGMHVVDTAICGRGVPDFIVIRPRDNRAWLIEAKSGDNDLTEAEMTYALKSRVPVWVVRTVEDLLRVLEVVEYKFFDSQTVVAPKRTRRRGTNAVGGD